MKSPEPLFYYPYLATPSVDTPDETTDYDAETEYDMETEYDAETDLSVYCRYTEAERIAKALLKDLGIPDVAFAELQMLERRFACGRCDVGVITWQETVRLTRITLGLLSLTYTAGR